MEQDETVAQSRQVLLDIPVLFHCLRECLNKLIG